MEITKMVTSKKHNVKVIEDLELNPRIKCFKLKRPKEFEFKSGQFIMLSFDVNGKNIKRAYSIASWPSNKEFIELVIKAVPGGNSEYLVNNLKKGDKIDFLGPLGHFSCNNKEDNLVFVSVGVGLAPFRSMIFDLLSNENNKNKTITFITGYRTKDNELFKEEFEKLTNRFPNFSYHLILSRPIDQSYKFKGYVQDFLKDLLLDKNKTEVYICGLNDMVNGVKDELLSIGISEDRIFFEKWG